MAEHDFHETPNMYPNLNANLSNDQQFRLNKINEIKDYFIAEIKERELMSKRLSKYIASFDHFDKSLIVLSVATGSIYIASFVTVIGAPVGISNSINEVIRPVLFFFYDKISQVQISTKKHQKALKSTERH